jgi:hypothetical protein
MTTDAKEPEVIRTLRHEVRDGNVFLHDKHNEIVCATAVILQAYDLATQRAEAAESDTLGCAMECSKAVDRAMKAEAERDALRTDAADFLSYVERQQCLHEETHRGGAIWEICDMCGSKWADDEGGKPAQSEPKEITRFREAIDAARTADALVVQPTTGESK